MKQSMTRLDRVLFSLGFFIFFLGISVCHVSGQSLDTEEQLLVELINDYRAQSGLSRLKVSIALTKAADWMSADMAAKNYFSHVDSTGRDPFARMLAYGYGYTGYKGENIAAGNGDAVRTFQQWKNSPTHNSTMLHPNFYVIGISRAYNGSSKYKWYWTTDFGQYIDATLASTPVFEKSLETLNAASFQQTVSPDALAATFGTSIGTSTAEATTLPLPTSMGGVSVTINGVTAPLVYVSPGQINYVVPSNVNPGTATVNVVRNGSVIANGPATVAAVSPSIFTVGANGRGVPAALTTYDGVSFQTVANDNGTAKTVSVGTTSQPNYLILFGTGLRRRSSLSNARVLVGGAPAEISYVGAHPRFTGLDQVNVKLPAAVRGRGMVDVSVIVDGKASNIVQIYIQ